MTLTKPIVACLFSIILGGAAQAQEGKVIVVNTELRDLKRTASRLRVSVDRVKNARSALQEATDLARRIDPMPMTQTTVLGQYWVLLDRSKAADKIGELLAVLQRSARTAKELSIYSTATSTAEMLLVPLAGLDLEKAMEIVNKWPSLPANSGEAGDKVRSNLQNEFRDRVASSLAYRDPEQALAMVSESLSGTGSEYYIRARAAEQLLDKGRKDDALKLVDETMANFAEHRSDPQAIEGYANFVGELVNIDPDRFLSALAQLAGSETVAPGYGGSLKIGNKIIQLTYSEAQILGVISSTERRPEITLKAINSLPELKSKLDQIGGIDGYLTPGRSAGRVELSVTSPKGLAAGSRMSGEDDEAGTRDIYADLHGKARKNPWYVQAKLSEIGRDPNAISKLISLAQRAIHEEPELSDLALEAAIPLISKVQPLQKRAESLMNLITAYTYIEGEADQGLLHEGFLLADQIREEEKQRLPSKTSGSGVNSLADRLESFLVVEFARDNFDSAMRFVRSMPDENQKLTTLIGIARALRH